MSGLFLGFLILIALIPTSVWFVIKCLRAAFVPAVKEDFKNRPLFHLFWALTSLVCLNGILRWL
jgi:regulator of PEP synthase PpsR (kinase-PPPase family)